MYEKPKSYEARSRDYVYIPYWIIKLEQIIGEVREKKIQRYDKNKDIRV